MAKTLICFLQTMIAGITLAALKGRVIHPKRLQSIELLISMIFERTRIPARLGCTVGGGYGDHVATTDCWYWQRLLTRTIPSKGFVFQI